MERCTRSSCTSASQSCARSEKVEIFILFPLRRFHLRRAVLLHPFAVAAELASFQAEEIIDEHLAELTAIERGRLERLERLGEPGGQERPLGRVRIVVARPGLRLRSTPSRPLT